jgi:hypothetical protein
MPLICSAAVSGNLNTGGSGNIVITINGISFTPSETVVGGTTVRFDGCPTGTLGTAGCLAPNENLTVAGFTTSTPLPLANFITFAGNGSSHKPLSFNVESIDPGLTNTNCQTLSIGQSCSLYSGSPIILTAVPGGTSLGLSFHGHATDGTASAPYTGAFSSFLTGTQNGVTLTPAGIQNYFCPIQPCTQPELSDTTKSISGSQSGSFNIMPIASVNGFMTGGGMLPDYYAVHGFDLGCATTSNHDDLEINWLLGNNFKLTSMQYVDCYLDPSRPSPGSPNAGFNSLYLVGTGKFNNQPGATIMALFTDAGQTGFNDMAYVQITYNGHVVLNVPFAKIAWGNQQAHK